MILIIYAVGLILFILFHWKSVLFDTVHIDFLPFHNVHPMSFDWSMYVHGMVPACCSKSIGSYSICVVDVSSEPEFNVHVLSVVMLPVDMGRFFLPLCSII